MDTLNLLLNPSSGGGRAKKLLPAILAGFRERGIDIRLRVSESADHLRRLAAEAAEKPGVPLLCAGGDGSNRIVVDALLETSNGNPLPVLGFIPAGRGNSFLRDLRITSLDEALTAVAEGRSRPIDVARFTSGGRRSHFINCLGLGFISDVGRLAFRLRALGNASYAIGVLLETLFLRRHRLSLEIDGVKSEEDLLFIEISNSRMTGGSMLIAPGAQIDDGRLDLVLVGRMGRIGLLRTFPKIYSGNHGTHPAVRFIQAKQIRINAARPEQLLPDGDLEGTTPVEIEILPGRIRAFCMEGPAFSS